MKIKTKVAFGVVFLFGLILAIGGLGIYYLNNLSSDSKNILVDNYESLEYTKHIVESCDRLSTDSVGALNEIERNLLSQEENVTEGGEREATQQLRGAVEKLKLMESRKGGLQKSGG